MQTQATHSPAAAVQRGASLSFASVDTLLQPPERFVDVGHAKLAYRRVGQGPDVLFVHGWPVSSSTFRGVVAELQRDYTCHLIDLPGAGHTRWTDESRIGFREHTETVVQAIDQLGLERVAIISHDSGGAIARLIAAARHDVVVGLVMGNTEVPGYTPSLIKLLKIATAVPGGARLFIEGMRIGPLRRSRKLGFGTCFEDQALVDADFRALTLDPLLSDARSRDGAIALLRNFDHGVLESLASVHAQLKMPVRLVWGSKDPVFPLTEARGMLNQFGGDADLVQIDRGWLFAHEEYPREFAAHARPLLERCLG